MADILETIFVEMLGNLRCNALLRENETKDADLLLETYANANAGKRAIMDETLGILCGCPSLPTLIELSMQAETDAEISELQRLFRESCHRPASIVRIQRPDH